MKLFGPLEPLPEAAIAAIRHARIAPVLDYTGKNIIVYDMFLGPKWQGSRRSIEAAKYYMNNLLKRIEDDARTAARKHTPASVSQGPEGEKHHAGAL